MIVRGGAPRRREATRRGFGGEQLEIASVMTTAGDRWRLDVLDLRPAGEARAVVVAGHAMMVDRRTLCRDDRPCLARSMVHAGLRVLVPDLRGHGASRPQPEDGGAWTYDDLVADTEAYIRLAGEVAPGLAIVLLGHSLFGHTSLAYLGAHPEAKVAAVVALAVNIWNRRFDPRAARWMAKRAMIGTVHAVARLRGYVPARDLGVGTANEALGYWEDTARFVRANVWAARDGADYHANLGRVRCPVLHVLSEGDRLYASPEDAGAFLAPLGERREVWRLTEAEWAGRLGGRLPGHMGMVTRPECEPLWQEVAGWIGRVVGPDRGGG